MKKLLIGSTILASLLMVGCSGGGGGSSAVLPATTTSDTSGQLVDSYLENVDYRCGDFADTNATFTTDINGKFRCAKLPVGFYLGGLKLGEINASTPDNQVFPQDLVGVAREDIQNTAVVTLARLMQSCDDDANPSNGIRIRHEIKEQLRDMHGSFDSDALDEYIAAINESGDLNVTLVDVNDTIEHLSHTTEFVDALHSIGRIPDSLREALLTPLSSLSQEVKDSLLYMGNKERLAYDTYNKLYEIFPTLTILNNIATRSEYTHISIVQLLVKKYISSPSEFTNIDSPVLGFDSNISDIPPGQYDISAIGDLYGALIAKGSSSEQDALEVGCMVEVTDINDLLEKIQKAEDSNASDIVSAFEFLRDGSYSHYWAFDRALKAMGVTDGCCSLGEIDGVNYCHPEYPQGSGDDGSYGSNGNEDCDGDGGSTPGEGHGNGGGSRDGSGNRNGTVLE